MPTETLSKSKRRHGLRGAFRRVSLAEYLDSSPTSIARLDAAGLIPRGVKIIGAKFWRKKAIDQWLAMGCPAREEFEARLAARKAGRK